MKKFGYIRCSTAKSQGRQDTARQKRDIKDIAHSNDVVFYEDYMSGSKVNRTGYKTMLSDIEKAVEFGETDITIYCTEISRLSRSMQQLIDLIKIDDIPKVFFRYYSQYKDGQIKLTEMARLCGMARNTIYKYIKIVESQDK